MFTDEKSYFSWVIVQYEFSLRERCVKLRFGLVFQIYAF